MKNHFKILIAVLTVAFFLKNCETNEEQSIFIDIENTKNLNLKTVSFEDAKSTFHQNIKKEKFKAKQYAKNSDKPPLELSPDWNTIQHDEFYANDSALLTLTDVEVNREGEYISKLFFVNQNNKTESVIFTIYPLEVESDGKIVKAFMFFNELNGKFIDGYRIEEGKIAKRFIVKEDKTVQQASFFMIIQAREDDGGGGGIDPGDCWNTDTLNLFPGGILDEVVITASVDGDDDEEPEANPYTGVFRLNNVYIGQRSSGGGSRVNSVAGSLYVNAINEKTLAEGEELENVPPSCESFNFTSTGSNWQTAVVKGVRFKLRILEQNGAQSNVVVADIAYDNNIQFGTPKLDRYNSNFTPGLAAELSAEALHMSMNETKNHFRDKYNISETQIRIYFEERLRYNYPIMTGGGRVNFGRNDYGLIPTQYKTEFFGTGNCN